jgi:hypothetical protein
MGHGIKLGQVYSNPFVKAFKPQTESPQSVSVQIKEESEDHEVSMANGQLDYIIKSANELKGKLGSEEKEIPGWIQDHISKAHSYLHQANSGYHEYDDNVNESVNEGIGDVAIHMLADVIGYFVAIGATAIIGFIVKLLWSKYEDIKSIVSDLGNPSTFKQFTKALSKDAAFNKKFVKVLDSLGGVKNVRVSEFLGELTKQPEFINVLNKFYPNEDSSDSSKLSDREKAVNTFKLNMQHTLNTNGMWLVNNIKKKFPNVGGVNESKLSFADVKYGDKIVNKFRSGKEYIITSVNKKSVDVKNIQNGNIITLYSLNNYELKENKISQPQLKSIYDKLSKGDEVNITFDSSISKNISKRLKVVKGKTVVGNNGVERITLVNVDNPNSVKYYLYNRNNNISLAQGDMGTSVVSVQKESINENNGMKLTKILNEQNTSFNKYLLQFVDNYIESNQFPKGSPQYQWALATLLSATLTDANFHQAAKKAKSVFRKAEEPDNSNDLEYLISRQASHISKKAKWDGDDIIDGFAYVTAMRIGGPAMGSVTALKNESVTEASEAGEWVAYVMTPKGDKLMGKFPTARGAKMWLNKNSNKLLSTDGIERVGVMSKGEWDKYHAKWAIEGVNEGRNIQKIQKDFNDVVLKLRDTLEKYKSAKGTSEEKKWVEELKKLTALKKKFQAELDKGVQSLYADAEYDGPAESKLVSESSDKINFPNFMHEQLKGMVWGDVCDKVLKFLADRRGYRIMDIKDEDRIDLAAGGIQAFKEISEFLKNYGIRNSISKEGGGNMSWYVIRTNPNSIFDKNYPVK